MATQTLAAADAILKNVYRGTIVELLNQETYLIDQLEKTNANDLGTFNGRQLIFAVHTGRNRGRGALVDGGTLATPGTQAVLDAIVAIKYFDQAVELTDMLIKQTLTDEGAFVKGLSLEMDRAMGDLRKDVSRMGYGTGDGVLANCTATQSATTISVDSGQYIAVGDIVDVLTKATGAVKGSALTVTAVAYTGTANSATQANANITLSSSVSVTAADSVYISGDRNNESDGLRNIIATGRTLHSINSSTNPIWDSNVLNAAQANPSEDLLMQLSQTIRQRSGKSIDMFLGTLGGQRRLANTYASQKRWNNDSVLNIQGGYSAIMVAAGNQPVPFISDVDAVNGVIFALNKESFAWSEVAKADWLEPPTAGGSIFMLKDGSTAGSKLAIWQAWIVWYATLVCIAPHRNGKLINVNDDLPVARL